jgi:tetratricopeptide (TPR) repeat protein
MAERSTMTGNRMHFARLAALLFLLLLLSQPLYARQKSSPRQLERAMREGKELYEENHYLGAIDIWKEILKKDPWNEEAKLLIEKALKQYEELTSHLENGYAYLEEGRIDAAQEEFDYVQANSSENDEELQEMVSRGFEAVGLARRDRQYMEIIGGGDQHLELQEFDAALAAYEEARNFFPEGDVAPKRIELTMEKKLESELGTRLRSLREEGRRLFAQDKFKASQNVWEEVVELIPEDEEAELFLSKIAFNLQEREKLLEMARGYFENGQRLYAEKQFENAIDQFENAIAMNYQINRSRKYIEDCREAIRRQEAGIREHNAELVARFLREGIKFYNLNRYRDSLTQLNRGLELDPENSQIKEYILRDIIALKREEEKAVLPTSPFFKLVENLKLLGAESYQQGDYQSSVRYYEEILLIFPFNEEARISLTRALGKTDPTLAAEILDGMYRDARQLVQRGKKREAVAKLKLIQEVNPGYRDTVALIRQLEEERTVKEEEQRKVVTEKDRKQAERLYRKGLDLYAGERLEEAIETWRQALELNPEYVDARVDLSRAESKLRNLQRAEAGGSGAEEASQDELTITIKRHYLEGVNLYMNGLYAEAISEWEEVLRLNPVHENARNNIERARKRLEVSGEQGSS